MDKNMIVRPLARILYGENLGSVADEHAGPGTVVEEIVDEDHAKYSLCCGVATVFHVLRGTDGPNDEGAHHTGGGEKEELATTDLVNEEAHSDSDKQVPDLKNTVDDILGEDISIAELIENLVDIVRDKAVAGPLGEEARCDHDEHTVTIALGADKFLPSIALKFLLKSDCVANLGQLKLHQVIVHIAVGMCVGQNFQSLLITALCKEPTWRLRDEENEADLQSRWEDLDKGWCSPGPVVVNVVCAVCQPSCNNRAKVPQGVVNGGKDGAVLRVAQLRNQQWGAAVRNGDAKTDEESSCDEHPEVDGDGLEDNSKNHHEAADEDTKPSTEPIRDVWDDRKSSDGANRVDGVQQSKKRAGRVVEVGLPVAYSLQAIHH